METWNSTCYDIDMKDGGRRRYCNVTDLWQPTITKTDGYVVAICIFIFAVVVTIVSLRRMKFLKDLCCVFGRDVGCCTLSSFVFAVIAGAVWKIADVIIDCFTFYRLGSGSLIDGLIYRNGDVLNSIVAFTVVGVVGMILRFRLVHLKADDIQNKQDVQTVKLLLVLISFCLEDSVQMFLEYFWIQIRHHQHTDISCHQRYNYRHPFSLLIGQFHSPITSPIITTRLHFLRLWRDHQHCGVFTHLCRHQTISQGIFRA
ncbi:uncharacterized protein [Clytia hemisphaerica]|uniref:Uncharacterized protein n=1 Tax=Clytia hemisphaerica TaxID=252671 RepID=A0A7M5U7Q3_9CNID